MKISFKNDYSEGCHPRILEALTKNNLDQQDAYGQDEYSQQAIEHIKKLANAPLSKIHFVSGGTQANLVVISAMLRPHESVISASTGHIATNETGAIEATGHKVSTAETEDGKLNPLLIQAILDEHNKQPHQLKPRMIYISNSTEVGTTYSKIELETLADFCKDNDLLLFMDGARLGQALVADNNDISLADVAKCTDVFYLGGTKNGALIGEAIVINNVALQANFEYNLKQKGALLSKGRLMGMQFQELLKDDLYFDLARHANQQAMKIKKAFQEIGCGFMVETFTNQIFPILSNEQIKKLAVDFDFYVWRKINAEKSAVRIITSWATKEEHVDAFVDKINNLKAS